MQQRRLLKCNSKYVAILTLILALVIIIFYEKMSRSELEKFKKSFINTVIKFQNRSLFSSKFYKERHFSTPLRQKSHCK